MLGSLVFLTPLGGLVALAVLVPLAGLALAVRRERVAREILRLPAPPPVSRTVLAAALVAVPLLLGLAATQPALRTQTTARVRTDAQAFFVFDISRSMMAARSATSPTRLARAKADAIQIRDALPQVPAGIATLTDRTVPNLFPTVDETTFREVLSKAVTIENPPPQNSNVLATKLCAPEPNSCPVGSLGTENFFPTTIRRRLVVLLTDGESVGVDTGRLAHDLRTTPGVKLVVVHVWNGDEKVFDANGKPETAYRVHPESRDTLAAIAQATGAHVYGEGSVGAAAHQAAASLGSGPTIVQGRTQKTTTLAPYIALLALLPLVVVLRRGFRRGLGLSLREGRAAVEQALRRNPPPEPALDRS